MANLKRTLINWLRAIPQDEHARELERIQHSSHSHLEQLVRQNKAIEDQLESAYSMRMEKRMEKLKFGYEEKIRREREFFQQKASIIQGKLAETRSILRTTLETRPEFTASTASSLAESDWQTIGRVRCERAVSVDQPMMLISQVQRSGGTLLSQLFDDHPECHAHPYELYIGRPTKSDWPHLDLRDSPEKWFDDLFETPVVKGFLTGYTKYAKGRDETCETFPFLFPPSLQKEIFLHQVKQQGIHSQRDVLNCYFSSYFNAWLDYRNLYCGPKKWITGFVPGLAMNQEHVGRFFEDYPDGMLTCLLRDPKTWYISARKHQPELLGEVEQAMAVWTQSTQAALTAKHRFGQRVVLLAYEDLVVNAEGIMNALACVMGISFESTLLRPTFNGRNIKADSSFPVAEFGIIKDTVERHKHALSPWEVERIEKQTASLLAEALALKLSPIQASNP